MATSAPTGMATTPARITPTNHGSPAPVVKWQKLVAPTATKVTWHSDTCPETSTTR